ncbi:Nodulin-like [Seminavis robusta]|uniref:Nodulin-like n=1 Tax=Seminavis robusta TaxID=568900 RepID=A0A9N8HRT7_9STRA|nr:Nodulin-like [Seminavis robusta]|eukprot:Sro1437_g272610.1 Nodulin-like (594) ;mRNA; f:26504-28285
MRKYVSRQESTLGRRRSNIPSLVCAFAASATTGGTIYCFGVLANDLKKALQITQMQLGAVSAAFFIAGLISWIPGMVVDRMKMRFSMSCGGLSGATFTTIYWILCRNPGLSPFFRDHPVAVLSCLAIAICLSCGLIVGSVFKLTLLCGGRDGKGPAVGIAKGFVGLGSGVYATLFQAIRDDNESTLDFLLVIAFFFILNATLPALFLLPPKEESHPRLMRMETTPLHFRTMYASLAVLCLFILGSAICDIWSVSDDQPKGRNFGNVLMILILWLGPIVSLLYLPRKREEEEEDELITESTSLLTSGNKGEADEEDQGSPGDRSWIPDSPEEEVLPPPPKVPNVVVDFRADLSLPEMLQTSPAWIMLCITLVLVGSGTAKTNNMGQMVEALGFTESVTPATLAIFSVAQAAARISTGILSEAALKWSNVSVPSFIRAEDSNGGIPRPFFLVIACSISLLAHLLLAASTDLVSFVFGCAISAIAFGMAWPLMVLIVGDVFGVEHHGANYMFFDGGTKALGTLLLSEFLAGFVYEAHVDNQHHLDQGVDGMLNACWGPQCFRDTHLVIAGLSLICMVASLLLCYQTRFAYGSPLAR